MPKVADRVAETTTTTGTGTVTLAGAKTGYRTFTSAFSNADKVYYCITDNTDWEVGVGTFTSAGTTLSRNTIFASSNAGAAVNFAAGSKDVFCTAPMQSITGAPRLQAKTGAYTVVASDNGSVINCTSGTFTVSLTAAATLGAGFVVWVVNSGTGDITIDPNGTETLNGSSASYIIKRAGPAVMLLCDGAGWQTIAQGTGGGFGANGRNIIIGENINGIGVNAISVGNGSRSDATNSIAVGNGATATSSNSTAIGLNSGGNASQAVTGAGAMALGGGYASGINSFAAAIANNSSSYGATGASSVALGENAKATGSNWPVALGASTVASGLNSIAIGYGSQATASHSVAMGRSAVSNIIGKFAFTGYVTSAAGDGQTGTFVMRMDTTNATPTVVTTDGGGASTTNQVILPNDSSYTFTGSLIARNTATDTESKAWTFFGAIRRGVAAANTALIGTPGINLLGADTGTSAWTVALTADTTNGGLAVTVTGEAAKTIRWVCRIDTVEVTG